MDLELNGRTALVTGSSRGIGLAIARVLAHEGCHVILNGRDRGRLEDACKLIDRPVEFIAGDVTIPETCRDLAGEIENRYGHLDILVTNVGSGHSVPPGMETSEEWRRVFDINLFSATNIIAACRDLMTPGLGAILCISSICGHEILGAPLTYSSAKAALNHYVRGMARVLACNGVRINALEPGNILDEGGTWERKLREDENAVRKMLAREVALGRLGNPEEIADMACFLVSPRASFATGAVFTVDGGQTGS